MSLVDYFPILLQIILALTLSIGILVASHVFGQRSKRNKAKDSAYECGLPATGKMHPKFAVKFYLTAMLFILFDIEVVFLLPWALSYQEHLALGLPILGPILFFMGLVIFGLFYEIKQGGLIWKER
jgi:NADH-quinone oxidoreductase subunit A